MIPQLDKIFKPETIALIGASDREGSVGSAVMNNLLTGGFEGKIFPINPKSKTIHGKKAYKSIGKTPKKVDLAIITTPAKTVPDIVKECGEAGVGGLLIISAGFAEAGAEGQKMMKNVMKTIQKYGMRMIGPNCLGFVNPNLGVNATFASKSAPKGKIAFISQSGALCTSILDWATDQDIGFSHFVSIGSMADVGFGELIDYFGTDPHTSSILIYMESIKDARKFMSAARSFSKTKPIIVLKSGSSDEGGQASMSHTGSLAGADEVFDEAFKRAGIIRVNTISQLFDCAQALAMQPRPKGNRLAIVTNAGGPGVLATDYLMNNDGKLAELSEDTMTALNEFLPDAWSHGNPIDVLGDATPEAYRKTIDVILKDPGVDGVVTILTPQAMTDPAKVAKEMVKLVGKSHKTLLATWMGSSDVQKGRDVLEKGKIPNYLYPESAVDAFLKMYQYSDNLQTLQETPAEVPNKLVPNKNSAWRIIRSVLEDGRKQLTENEAKDLMSCYGMPVGRYSVVQNANQAARFADEIGYPVVMKIASPDIGHKTEAGGVMIGLKDAKSVRKGFETIMGNVKKSRPKARLEGVLIEKMATKPFELLFGAKKDPIFGPIIVFGQGGVAVEVFKDTQMGIPPLNMALAKPMIEKTRIYPLLKGFRGKPGVNVEEVANMLVNFSYLVMDFPEIVEMDINPFVFDEEGGLVLDGHVVLDKYHPRDMGKEYKHMVISPYPEKYVKQLRMKTGQEITLRPIRPEDEPLQREMLSNLSDSALHFRFFGSVPKITHELLARFTQIDYDREISIIAEAEVDGKKKMVGSCQLMADAWGESAEFSVVVSDDWQNQELGSELTDYALEIARERGIKTIYAVALKNNLKMVNMFEQRGFKITKEDMDMVKAELDISSAMPFAAD